jgi:hypothetical protein
LRQFFPGEFFEIEEVERGIHDVFPDSKEYIGFAFSQMKEIGFMQVNHTAVKEFVRNVLGCGCPEEVFKRIEVSQPNALVKNSGPDYQINIGGRLLIWVIDEESLGARALAELVQEGKATRDAERFNRFRLVVLSEQPDSVEKSLSAEFRTVAGDDERVHLHVVATNQLPHLLS